MTRQTKPRWTAVFDFAEQTMTARGWTKKQLYDNTGVSETTFVKMTKGAGLKRIDKIRGLEKGLGWQPGSVESILAGGEPTSLNGFHPVDEQPDRIGKLEADLSQLRAEVLELRTEGEQLALDVEESRAVILRLLAIRPDVGVGEAPPSAPEVGQ